MLTITEVKAAVKAGTATGQQFQNAAGATGTVLVEVSERGKPLAAMTCTKPTCTALHNREISDWHQSHRCKEHPANRSGKSKKTRKDPQEAKATIEAANAALLEYAAEHKHQLPAETTETLSTPAGDTKVEVPDAAPEV
jgi:hypothetical protein